MGCRAGMWQKECFAIMVSQVYRVECVQGQLTDHYNPADKTINLSPDVYNGRNISAAAVAAHECGHAVQHAKAYAWLGFRSKLVPAVSFSSKWVQWILLAGVLTCSVVSRNPAGWNCSLFPDNYFQLYHSTR